MQARPPNILFIISDQHNPDVLGCQGHPHVLTPNLDRLASQSTRFVNAIPQSPICTPSRVSFLSGQYCHNHGYYGLGGRNPGGLPTILGHFRRNGYRIGAIGKMHCPEYWVENDCDVFMETNAGCSVGGNPHYAAYLRERKLLELRDDDRFPEQDRGEPSYYQSFDARPSKLKYEDCVEGWIARQTMEFMRQSVVQKRPFFAFASLPRPHQIHSPSRQFWDMYDPAKLTLPPNADYDMAAAQKSPLLRQMAEEFKSGKWALFEPRTFQAARLRKLHGYLACVTQVDHAVGELLAWLDSQGLAENTIVVYASDHGEYVCQHGNMEKAPGICSNAVCRIPFIWRWPGRIQPNQARPEVVESIDLTATLCSLAGVEALQTSDGRDITPLLQGKSLEVHRAGVTEGPWSRSIRKGKYRYVHYPVEMFAREYPDGFGELYDLQADPWEMQNLYFSKAHAGVVCELRTELLNFILTTTRPVTILPHVNFFSPQGETCFGDTTNHDGHIHYDWIAKTKNKSYL